VGGTKLKNTEDLIFLTAVILTGSRTSTSVYLNLISFGRLM